MDRIRKNHKILCYVCKHAKTKKQRQQTLKHCNSQVTKALVDIVHNLLKGNVRLSSQQKSKLKRYKQHLRFLAKPSKSLESKKRYLVQKGGFLPFLAPLIPLLATIGPIIAKGALAGAAGTAASAAIGKIIEKAKS
jgi:hypothetical protein